jgi:haloalkane dehalogenase
MLTLVALVASGAPFACNDEISPGVLRTPDARFADLPDYPFPPNYKTIAGYRLHYLDEGPPTADPVLLLHGEPTWSYLYRKMIPPLTAAGHRCIAPDLIGFGKSDKPRDMNVHTYQFHVDAIAELVAALNLQNATFFGQDWGGLIGLRVVAENQHRFARVVISNTSLPTGDETLTPEFTFRRALNLQMIEMGDIAVGTLVSVSRSNFSLKEPYDAPFPSPAYKAGPLIFPQLVPVTPDDPASQPNRNAWKIFQQWEKPFLTVFGYLDPLSHGLERRFINLIPGAQDQPHTLLEDAGHFLQESHGPQLAEIINTFIQDTN